MIHGILLSVVGSLIAYRSTRRPWSMVHRVAAPILLASSKRDSLADGSAEGSALGLGGNILARLARALSFTIQPSFPATQYHSDQPSPPDLGDASTSIRVRHDDAGVDGKGFPSHDPFLHSCHYGLERLAQETALAEATVSVLGKRLIIGDAAIEPQPTEPAVGQIKMGLFAQPPLRANAEAVADDEHSDHPPGSIEGRPVSP